MKPGHDMLLLARAKPGTPVGPMVTSCAARIGAETAHDGKGTISGTPRSRLACYQGLKGDDGFISVQPGTCHLTLGIRLAPNGLSPKGSIVVKTIRISG